MKEFLKKNKKYVLLILAGALGIASAAIGLSEDLQLQLIDIFDKLIPSS
ncbi:hypothetical protein [Brevibacillus reuszeri]|nr:hypothetical protein [Brevibacillus reuszeri]